MQVITVEEAMQKLRDSYTPVEGISLLFGHVSLGDVTLIEMGVVTGDSLPFNVIMAFGDAHYMFPKDLIERQIERMDNAGFWEMVLLHKNLAPTVPLFATPFSAFPNILENGEELVYEGDPGALFPGAILLPTLGPDD